MAILIDNFRGKYGFLSNFYASPIVVSGQEYPTVEHAFQACKTMDSHIRRQIAKLGTPAQAKKAGRQLELFGDWDNAKAGVMYDLLQRKFDDFRLAGMLQLTGDAELVEGNNWHDNYWGECGCGKCRCIDGQNMLGEILMVVRDEI